MAPEVKINQQQLPIKAHYFFFMAAMGPILPFLSVYGKQLGVSTVAMGTITAILPILYLISKPTFGFIVDYFYTHRKNIFVGILISCSLFFVLLYFLPKAPDADDVSKKYINSTLNISISQLCDRSEFCRDITNAENKCDEIYYQAKTNCSWMCSEEKYFFSPIIVLKNNIKNNSTPWCLISFDIINNQTIITSPICTLDYNVSRCDKIICQIVDVQLSAENTNCLYRSFRFWIFVLLMSLGSIGFNVANSISDAICFDVLGEGGSMGYGRQRVWGTIGFGISAFFAGYAIDLYSQDEIIKSYTPAFILTIVFTCMDVFCARKLELPIISGSKNIAKDIVKLLKMKTISTFLIFATLAGVIDSFIIYFLFWYLEDLAQQTHHMDQIKLIEGLIVAAETLGGEVIFFSFSGKILKKFGYGYSLTFCFICYALRLGLISIAPNPWWVVPVELLMQGPSYALCYTIIVGFASVIAPPGTSATVQGIVAGMDDGFGFALGSLIGGILYNKIGGTLTLRVFSGLAVVAAISYFLLYTFILKDDMPKTKTDKNSRDNIIWKNPENAIKDCDTVSPTEIN